MSDKNIGRILNAMTRQRWYFFENKPHVLMDIDTGLLWANLESFPYTNNSASYTKADAEKFLWKFNTDGFGNWVIPTYEDLKLLVLDKTFPFQNGNNYRMAGKFSWLCNFEGLESANSLDLDTLRLRGLGTNGCLIPCNDSLVKNNDYRIRFAVDKSFSTLERAKSMLNIFVNNELIPDFDEPEITELFKKMYVENHSSLAKLQENNQFVPCEIDFDNLLAHYDPKAIDASIIQFILVVKILCAELLLKIDVFERQNKNVFNDFNAINLKLSTKYKDNPNLTQDENLMLKERQKFFQDKFSLGMDSVRKKILAVKNCADILDSQLEEASEAEDPLTELAKFTRVERPKFSILTENLVRIISNALKKIEFFVNNRSFVENAIKILSSWTEDYVIFRTIHHDELRKSCEDDSIESEIFESWFSDWQKIRYRIESKLQILMDYFLNYDNIIESEILEKLIKVLESYKESVDKFFLNERKGIYQKFAFQTAGDLQEKLESESELYKCTYKFQSELQEVIFSFEKSQDRFFVLNCMSDLFDIQIDEVLKFVEDRDLRKISSDLLDEFSRLRLKNYDTFLSDARAYSDAQSKREKEYNSLIFKMRKDLAK